MVLSTIRNPFERLRHDDKVNSGPFNPHLQQLQPLHLTSLVSKVYEELFMRNYFNNTLPISFQLSSPTLHIHLLSVTGTGRQLQFTDVKRNGKTFNQTPPLFSIFY